MALYVYGASAVILALLWVFYRVLTGSWDLALLVQGADGRASTSKFQWLLWTIVVFFAYVALTLARAMAHQLGLPEFQSPNLLIAMGLSAFTALAAKGITTANVANGNTVKIPKVNQSPNPGELVTDDNGYPDLSKMQLLSWTILAIAIFMSQLITAINITLGPTPRTWPPLPDIDPTLMVLMGLGQAAYLGKKLVTSDVPRLVSISPGRGVLPATVVVRGQGFGASRNGSQITIDQTAVPIEVADADWGDTTVKFSLPAASPTDTTGTAWPVGTRLEIGLIVAGQDSANTVPFIVDKAGS